MLALVDFSGWCRLQIAVVVNTLVVLSPQSHSQCPCSVYSVETLSHVAGVEIIMTAATAG